MMSYGCNCGGENSYYRADGDSLFFSRHMKGSVGVVASSVKHHHHHIDKTLFGDSTITCRGLILHLNGDNDNSTLALR